MCFLKTVYSSVFLLSQSDIFKIGVIRLFKFHVIIMWLGLDVLFALFVFFFFLPFVGEIKKINSFIYNSIFLHYYLISCVSLLLLLLWFSSGFSRVSGMCSYYFCFRQSIIFLKRQSIRKKIIFTYIFLISRAFFFFLYVDPNFHLVSFFFYLKDFL